MRIRSIVTTVGIIIILLFFTWLGQNPIDESTMDDRPKQITTNTMSNYTTTDSGLQYKILQETEGGARPSGPTTQVEVHYEGRLADGSIFDSSRERGQTITFGLNQVIAGWSEGVQLMSEGDTYEFNIPAKLAYGTTGVPGVIPPNSDLVFEVELIRVIN